MIKYSTSLIGQFHINYNEDFLVISNINKSVLMIAVMDGCSMGTESYFASTAIGKILRKATKEIAYLEFVNATNRTLKFYQRELLGILFKDLSQLKNNLLLEIEEVLSTLILGIVDIHKRRAEVICIGDGLVCCNGKIFEYEQDDKPDYLAYHIHKEFENWFQAQEQRLSLEGIDDLSLSTDGLFSFKPFDDKLYDPISEEELIQYLLIDQQWQENENMLRKKLLQIEKEYGLKPSDDISIIRLIK